MHSPSDLDELSILRQLHDTPEIMEALALQQGTELAIQKKLRSRFPEPLVRAALTLHDLRHRGRDKFSRAPRMWFTRTSLEQATAEPVALHKARRFSGPVVDLCSGIGSDSIALARQGCSVESVDLSPVACQMTNWNAAVYEVAPRIQTHVSSAESWPLQQSLVHIDPDRRADESRRSLRIEDSLPGLDFLQNLTRTASGGAIKLSPASNFGGKFPDTELELISLHRECKEATIWFGSLADSLPARATTLPSGETFAADPWTTPAPLSPLAEYILDPDPALVRAGLVDAFANTHSLLRLDESEEYLTSSSAPSSSLVTPFQVLAELSNNTRDLRTWFRNSNVGQLEIKCRHVPVDPHSFRKQLPLKGPDAAVLFIARIAGRTRAVLARRLSHR